MICVPYLEFGDFEYPTTGPNWQKVSWLVGQHLEQVLPKDIARFICEFIKGQAIVLVEQIVEYRGIFSFIRQGKEVQYLCEGDIPRMGQWSLVALDPHHFPETASWVASWDNGRAFLYLARGSKQIEIPCIERQKIFQECWFVTTTIEVSL